ncbi:SAV_2336 N-terminal domain-related protein [Streptomyces sp. NPDC008317]|uniref:SAV_2336 N-terminal domain-related protein n=1 Tax=Streptomyces sp. NPDC008317 TaxID=3364827 RepID=UPI0036EA8851
MPPPPPPPPRPPEHPDGLRAVLAGLLGGHEDGPTAVEMADVVWLARLAGLTAEDGADEVDGGGPEEPPRAVAPEPDPVRPGSEPAERERAPDPVPGPRRPPAAPATPALRVGLHSLTKAAPAPGGPAAHVVRVTQPPALSGSLDLARALRPLRQSVPAPGPAVLDEEATAQATGEAEYLLPVWRPASERRFSVDLLIDTGATMAVWHRLATELCTVLERHGAFGDVRCWSLSTDGPAPRLSPFRRRKSARPAAPAGPAGPRWSRALEDPAGRALLLVLTDGVGPAWYGDELPEFLARAGRERPVAALQVLPRRLWHRTALRTAPVELRVPDAARPVAEVRTAAAVPGLPRGARPHGVRWLPVMEVDGSWLAPWAGLVAGRVPGWSPMLAAPVHGAPRPARAAAPSEPPGPAERVARFRSGCSPDAFRLACHLAAAPLSLPVMRLVQQATVPGSGQTDLAELFLSGLIERRGPAPDDAAAPAPPTDPDEVVYDFAPGVRDALLAELTRTESLHVLDDVLARVSGRVAATFGGTLDFRALASLAVDAASAPAAAPENGASGRLLPERSLPFAEVAAAVLSGAGGQHRALARQLTAAAEGRALDVLDAGPHEGAAATPHASTVPHPEHLLPVPPVTTPPDPERMIGRAPELDTLKRTLRPSPADRTADRGWSMPSVAVVVGANGSGRTRLVQEYVRKYGPRHSFVHRIDARTRQSLREGLTALESALTPDREHRSAPPTDLWARLGAHRDWLLIFDRVRSYGEGLREALEGCLPPYGRGSVLFTVASLDGVRDPSSLGTVVTLGELTRAEIMDHLTANIEPDLLALDRSTPSRLYELAQRMPTNPGALQAIDVRAEFGRLFGSPDEPVLPLYEWATAKGDRGLAGYVWGGSVWLVAAGYGQGAHLWDAAGSAGPGVPLEGGPDAVQTLTVFPDANGRPQAAVAGIGGAVSLWDLLAGTRTRTLVAGPSSGAHLLTTFTDAEGRLVLVTAGPDVALRCWDPGTGTEFGSALTPLVGRVRALTFFTGPGARPLCLHVTGDHPPENRTVHVRDAASGEEVDSDLPARLGQVEALTTVHVHGRPDLVAAIDAEGTVTLWDTASAQPVGTVATGDTSRVVAVAAFNGTYGRPLLATASSFGRARIWDVASVTAGFTAREAADAGPFSPVLPLSPDLLLTLWLLDFLDTGDGVTGATVSALWASWPEGRGPSSELPVDTARLVEGNLAEVDGTALRLTESARTAVRARVTRQDAARFRRALVGTLSRFYPEPTPDPATWAAYESGPPFGELVGRVMDTREDQVLPTTDPILTLLVNWSRYQLLHGSAAEAERLALIALGDDRPLSRSLFIPNERQSWRIISLRARMARGLVRQALERCTEIEAAPGAGRGSPSAKEEAALARAELALWCGSLDSAKEEFLRLEPTVSRRGRRLVGQGLLRHGFVTGDLSRASRSYGRSPEPSSWAGRRDDMTAELLDSCRDSFLDASIAAARDEVSSSAIGAAVPLAEEALLRLRLGAADSGTEADLASLATAATREHFDLYLALTELLATSLAQYASGSQWAEREPYSDDRWYRAITRAQRHIDAMRPFVERANVERPHLYARFRTAEGHVLLAAGDVQAAAVQLLRARDATVDVYGSRCPLLPRLELLLARARELAGDRSRAEGHLSAAESLLDSLFADRPHQDRVTALRAKSLLARRRSDARDAERQAQSMAARLLADNRQG